MPIKCLPNSKGHCRDISEKRAAEESAQQTKDLLETINRNLGEGIYMGILDTRFLYVNDAFLKITGYKSLEEAIPFGSELYSATLFPMHTNISTPGQIVFLKIKIDVSEENAKIEFKDNGIGIKNEYLDKIFNMFYRATERSQGSGLGMYIVKQAVEKLNGKITISSDYGEGTKIKVLLPNMRA